jgi:DNA-binding MarR family transcriptional regulator
MHFMMPALKRAHLWSIALTREAAEEHELTAARFDLMHFVMTRRWRPRQFEISRALGVSAVTISRMVRRLAELGLVRRIVSASGRMKWVALTKEGRRRVRGVVRTVLRPQKFRPHFERLFGKPSEKTTFFMDDLYHWVRRVAEGFGPRTHTYWHWYRPPWHPDD